MTLAEFIEKKQEFLTHLSVERNIAENTQRAYDSDLNQFVIFATNQPKEERDLLCLIPRYL